MRTRHKSWQNQRPGWTRRVIWYNPQTNSEQSIRLKFEDEHGSYNLYFGNAEKAQAAFDAFREGKSTTEMSGGRWGD